jgi:polygalacturonase
VSRIGSQKPCHVAAVVLAAIAAGCVSQTRTIVGRPSTQPTAIDVRDFGATANDDSSDTKSIQHAIDAAAASGGGTVTIRSGDYVTGTLWMKSNVHVHVEAGATLLGSHDIEEFPLWRSEWEGPNAATRRAALFAGEKLENVSLTGRGTVDARGEIWWKLQRAAPKGQEILRPLLFRVIDSRNIAIDGLTFRNSPMWTLSPLACENVSITNVRIQNPPDSPNTDGINPESCKNVRISGCTIDVGDDCITLKSGKETDGRRELWPTENVTITNCTMMHGHGGVVLGSEMSGDVRNVTISNCVFVGTDRGLRFKSRRGRGGVIEDIRASNIVMDGVLVPISVNLFYAPGSTPGDPKVADKTTPFPVDAGTPRFRRLSFSNITAKKIQYAAAFVQGLPEMPVEDVSVNDCSFLLDASNEKAGAPDMMPQSEKVARGGFLATHVKGLTLRNVEIRDQLGPAVRIEGAGDVVLTDLILRSPAGDVPMILLTNVLGADVRGASLSKDAKVGLLTRGDRTSDVRSDFDPALVRKE